MPDWGELQEDQLRWWAAGQPGALAYRELASADALTFGEWETRSNRLARGLTALGVRKGDRVSLYVPGEEALRWIVAYAAVHKAGAVAVPTNTRLSVPELVTILGHAGISALVTTASLLDLATITQREVPSCTMLLSDGGEGAFDDDGSTYQVPVDLDDLADIMYTSGTTGLPKGVAVRHRNVAMIPNGEPPWSGGGWLHGAPLFTFAGIAFIYNPMKMGLTGLYQSRFDAEEWMRIVERERPIMGFLVPAMAELLVAHPRFADFDLSSLLMVSIGSAPLAPQTLRILQERLPDSSVFNSYGMTEAGPAYIVMPNEEATKHVGAIGKATPPMEMKIVDDDGNELPSGDVGELWTRLPGRQREYYRDPEATRATWTDDGWLRSGDLGYLDDDGFLYLVGRKKDLIIRGGNNVYPVDVEAVLIEHPDVREAAIVGVPHMVLGEDIAAFVALQEGSHLTADELREFCAARLADYKRPRQIHFIGELPRNATGKVMKHLLTAPPAP